MRKVGVIIYHRDLLNIYKKEWIDKCLESIRNQTFKNFAVYELGYSDTRQQWWSGSNYSHIPMSNHIEAMNHILDKAFLDGCDVVFNINLDDFYAPERFELQLKAIEEGYDLISSDFQIIQEIDGVDVLGNQMIFHDRDIKAEQDINHNVLAHPVIAYTKKFWDEYKYYNTDELGYEDFSLWKKAVAGGCKIKIIDKILLYYRISEKQTGRIYNSQGIKTK